MSSPLWDIKKHCHQVALYRECLLVNLTNCRSQVLKRRLLCTTYSRTALSSLYLGDKKTITLQLHPLKSLLDILMRFSKYSGA